MISPIYFENCRKIYSPEIFWESQVQPVNIVTAHRNTDSLELICLGGSDCVLSIFGTTIVGVPQGGCHRPKAGGRPGRGAACAKKIASRLA